MRKPGCERVRVATVSLRQEPSQAWGGFLYAFRTGGGDVVLKGLMCGYFKLK